MSQMQRDHAEHELEQRLRANFAEIARGVHFEVPPTPVRAQPMVPTNRIVGRRRFAFAAAVVAGCVLLLVGVLATRHSTTTPTHAPLTHSSVSTPPGPRGSRFEQLPAAQPITTMPTTAPGESRDAALLRLGYAAGTPVLPVANGSGQVVGYVKTSYLVGPQGGGAYPVGKPGYPITGLDGYTLYGWYTRDLGALPRSIAEYPARLSLVRDCVHSTSANVEQTPACVQAAKAYRKPFGAAIQRAQGDDEGEPIADGNRDGKVAGFIANPEQQMQRLIRPLNPATASRIGLGPTDLNPPIVDRQMYIVVNQHGEVVGYFGEAVSFIPLATARRPGFDIEAYRAEQNGDCVDHRASAGAARRFPYCPTLPQTPNFATNTPSKLANTNWILDSITDHGAHHEGPATLSFGNGTIAWATCNNASGKVHITVGVIYVSELRASDIGCQVDTYFHKVLLYGHNEASSWYIDTAGKLHLIDPTNRLILVFHRS